MFLLRVLGPTELVPTSGGPVDRRVYQPKRLALMVYLLLAEDGGFVRRDRVLGVFWPDVPDQKARQSLRQALHDLTQILGRRVVVKRGLGEIGIDTDLLGCDALAFVRAAAADAHDDALARYRGELLPAFHCPTAPEFENWLAAKRESLRLEASDSAWKIALRLENTGDAAGAISYGRRAVEAARFHETVARRFLKLTRRVSDGHSVALSYGWIAKSLQQEYELEPSPELQQLAGQLMSQHATPAAGDAGLLPHGATPETAQPPSPIAADTAGPDILQEGPPAETGRRHWLFSVLSGRRVHGLAAAALLIAAIVSLGWSLRTRGVVLTATAPQDFVIVVDTFVSLEAEQNTTSMRIIADEIRYLLRDLPGIRVAAASYVTAAEQTRLHLSGTLMPRSDGLRLYLVMANSDGVVVGSTTSEMRGPLTAATAELAPAVVRFVRETVARRVRVEQRDASAPSPRLGLLLQHAVRTRERGDSLSGMGLSQPARVAYAESDSLARSVLREAPAWPDAWAELGRTALAHAWTYVVADSPRAARPVLLDYYRTRPGKGPVRYSADVVAVRAQAMSLLLAITPADSVIAGAALARELQQELERGAAANPDNASIWATMSVVLQGRGDFSRALLAAERGYALDARLGASDDLLLRLFDTSLEAGDLSAADGWCHAITARWPDAWLGSYCRIVMHAWAPPGSDAFNVDSLLARLQDAPSGFEPRGWVAAAVAASRRGDAATARLHLERFLPPHLADTGLLPDRAWAYLAAGDTAVAVDLLRQYSATRPEWSRGRLRSSRFSALTPQIAM